MAKLQAEFDEAKAKEVELTNNYTDSDRKCKRAKSLIEKLSNESKSWKVSLEKNKADKLNVSSYKFNIYRIILWLLSNLKSV